MKSRLVLTLGLGCAIAVAAVWAGFDSLFGARVPTVTVQELIAAAATTGPSAIGPAKPLQLVDVRSDAEIAVSVIPGAITRQEYEANPDRYAGARIVPYCTVGYRSRQYTEKLLKQGVDAANFDASIIGWVRAEQPLITLQGEPTRRVHTWSANFEVPAAYEQVY
jgi:rhodanese-related sulfurtransferase